MVIHNYNDYPIQKEEHMQFIQDFSHVQREFKTCGVSRRSVKQTRRFFYNWLINHIENEDKKLGIFLKACEGF